MTETAAGGWSIVADNDGAAALISTIVQLDVNERYTRSDLADAAGVPLKELYLSDTLGELVTIGLLERVADADEATYVIEDDSEIYERALAFDAAVTTQGETESREI